MVHGRLSSRSECRGVPMSMTVSDSGTAQLSIRILGRNSISLGRSLERLASGFRINRAQEDPSGMIISEELRGQIEGIASAQRVVIETIKFLQTAESALGEVSRLLVAMKQQAIGAVNGSASAEQRGALNFEFRSAVASIERIFNRARYAGDRIFNLSAANTLADGRTFQIGEQLGNKATFAFFDAARGGSLNINGTNITFGQFQLLLSSGSTLLSSGAASLALGRINTSIIQISLYRGAMGSFVHNTLESQKRGLGLYLQELTKANSFIRDTNMGAETAALARGRILVQASTAMLAQANVLSQSVLRLLG